MEKEMPGEIVIDAPADVVWEILAHRYGDIAEWASIIKSSDSIVNTNAQLDALVSGRVCRAYGFGAVQEDLLEYDEPGMRFRYEASKGLPFFITYGENTWSVTALSENQALVHCKGVLRMGRIAGIFLFPVFNFVMSKVGERLLNDLKRYVESANESEEVI